jgi:hypothetical protein
LEKNEIWNEYLQNISNLDFLHRKILNEITNEISKNIQKDIDDEILKTLMGKDFYERRK